MILSPSSAASSTEWVTSRHVVRVADSTLGYIGWLFLLQGLVFPLLVLRATGAVAQMGLLTGAAGVAAVVAGRGQVEVVFDVLQAAVPGLGNAPLEVSKRHVPLSLTIARRPRPRGRAP